MQSSGLRKQLRCMPHSVRSCWVPVPLRRPRTPPATNAVAALPLPPCTARPQGRRRRRGAAGRRGAAVCAERAGRRAEPAQRLRGGHAARAAGRRAAADQQAPLRASAGGRGRLPDHAGRQGAGGRCGAGQLGGRVRRLAARPGGAGRRRAPRARPALPLPLHTGPAVPAGRRRAGAHAARGRRRAAGHGRVPAHLCAVLRRAREPQGAAGAPSRLLARRALLLVFCCTGSVALRRCWAAT